MKLLRPFIAAILSLLPVVADAAGTLPIVLTQQFSFTGCATAATVCGNPLAGGLVYFYQANTTTQQNSYQDTGLTIANPWPLVLDANGRVPPFYLADGSIHVRLTDSLGVVQFDYPAMLVIGPSSGGGGGGSVDPTTIASTGDIKYRATGETLSGWVKANGQTIGSASSGATGRANADTQALFTYLWTNCPDAHCPVLTGRGASAAADFAANKQITLLDYRGRMPFGLDDMGNAASGRLTSGNMQAPDTPTTPNGLGGLNVTSIAQGNLPNVNFPAVSNSVVTDPGHTHPQQANTLLNAGSFGFVAGSVVGNTGGTTQSATTGITVATTTTVNSGGSGSAFNVLNNSILGSWYIKL